MAHLNFQQRYTICVLLQQQKSITEIARTIGRDKSVVSREIARNGSQSRKAYNYNLAQQRCDLRKKKRHRFRRLTPAIESFIKEKIRQDYSPEQIVGYAKRMKIPCVSITTIYKYIWSDKANYLTKDKLFHHLRVGHKKAIKKYSKKAGLGVIPNRVMISERPKIVAKRKRFGDFEADTVWIANKAVIVTVNDRATGLSYIKALDNRKSDNVNQAIYEMLKDKIGMIKTITVDNGKEFYKHQQLAKMLKADVYFADPYASWQRGSNENTNNLYRQYFPRKTKLEQITPKKLQDAQNNLNNRPRKRYGYKSPIEVFEKLNKKQLLHL